MKWSYKIARLLGIEVYIHATFLLLLAFISITTAVAGGGWPAVTANLLFVFALFGCVLLHEYGHALMARRYGIGTKDITLLPIGGLARLERMPDRPSQELAVALAGPAVNVVIAALLAAWLFLNGSFSSMESVASLESSFAGRLFGVNLFLVAFNLLPAFPMDGGRVLRSLLAMRMDHARSTRIAAAIGQGMAVIFGFAGLFGNPMLLLIALFVWIGAGEEAAAAEMKSSFRGVPVREAMVRNFQTIDSRTTLGEVADHVLAGLQQDFPVLEGDRVVGLLDRQELFRGLSEHGSFSPVSSVMRREFTTVAARAPLAEALSEMKSEHGLPLLVTEHGTLVGLLSTENVGEFFMIRSSLEKYRPAQPTPLVRHAARSTV
jgi:Zn-dependent protease/predicted transcriptional regulator